jgi:hypothetical protein
MNKRSLAVDPQDQRWDDDETWLEVVQSELDPDQIAAIVGLCDRRPELWRRCATALLEERVLQQELRSLVRSQWTEKPLTAPAGVATNAASQHQYQFASSMTAKSDCEPLKPRANTPLNYLAIAAGILLTFAIGWQASRRHHFPQANSPALHHRDAVGNVASSAALDRAFGERAVSEPRGIHLAADAQSPLPPEEINRVNADALAKAIEVRPDPDWQSQTNELRRRGYEVQAQDGIVPVLLDDGSSAVVPFQQIKVRPRRNAY